MVAKDEYKPLDFNPDASYALVSKHKFDPHGILKKVTLTINSPKLLDVMKAVIGDFSTTPASYEQPVEMESPFMDLYHHWERIENFHNKSEDDTTRTHLGLLLTFMQGDMGKQRSSVQDMIGRGKINFTSLWTIFKPGKSVFDHLNIMVLSFSIPLDKLSFLE